MMQFDTASQNKYYDRAMIDSKNANEKISELEKKSQNAVYAGPIIGESPEIDKLYIDTSKNE